MGQPALPRRVDPVARIFRRPAQPEPKRSVDARGVDFTLWSDHDKRLAISGLPLFPTLRKHHGSVVRPEYRLILFPQHPRANVRQSRQQQSKPHPNYGSRIRLENRAMSHLSDTGFRQRTQAERLVVVRPRTLLVVRPRTTNSCTPVPVGCWPAKRSINSWISCSCARRIPAAGPAFFLRPPSRVLRESLR
jgi:hypothetical protein